MSDEFQFIDFYHRPAVPTHGSRWLRTSWGEAVAAAATHDNIDCYVTVQQFASSTRIESADVPETHYAPPFADFDSDDLAASQRDMLKLVHWAIDEMELDESDVRVWFSGKKGFHVLLNPTSFGVVADSGLTYIFKRMFSHLSEYLGLETLDMSVYSKRRQWRMEGTRHSKSGLYKIRLDHDEMSLDGESIRELAVEPRPSMEPWLYNPSEVAQAALQRFADEYLAIESATKEVPATLNMDAAPGDPVCVQDIMGNGLKKAGDRNKATVVLASYYKGAGRDMDVAQNELTDWALRLPAEHRRMDNSYVKANTKSVVSAVYGDDGYKFGCNFIRSLHGPKTDKDYERVACMGEDCPFVKPMRGPETIYDIHLTDVGNPDYIDKPVRTSLRIAGRLEQPYIVPRVVTLRALSEECERGSCSLHSAGGTMTRDFSNDPRMLIAMCNVNDSGQRQVIRDTLLRSNCKAFIYEVDEYIRVVELACVPKVGSTVGTKGELATGNYTFQRAYAIGEGTDFPVNSYYQVNGRIASHPKNQAATLFITAATPLQDPIEDFDIETARPLFRVFDDLTTTEAVLGHMLADIGINVAKVAGRQLALMGLLMTLHSPLTLDIEGEREGGWMSLLVVGDTGEAKSQLVERVMRHTALGELANAQNAGRTGLLYTIVNKDAMMNFIQWGSFVMNDRRLLVIDEASGLDKSEYAEMRNARRDGVFSVNKSVKGEAQTRTRLVVLSNPRYGKNMKEFATGIEAVVALFENADIRRFDLVIGFRNGSVTHSQIEKELAEPVEHLFTGEVLRANMLWAWSRKPDEIEWMPGALDAVKEAARKLNRKYQGSGIHLLSQDATEKVARMTQSLAAMVHSTDMTHTKIVVKPEHAVLVSELLEGVYSATDLEYDLYVSRNRESETTNYDELGSMIASKMSFHGVDEDSVLNLFSKNKSVTPLLMEAICGDPKVSKNCIRTLVGLELVRQGGRSGGLEPTPMFNEYLRRWGRSKATL